MYFVLDEKTYKLLLKVKHNKTCKSDGSKQFSYLTTYGFLDSVIDQDNLYEISSKGEIAIDNYRENKYLILFNRIISVTTLLIALVTLIISIYQVF